MSHRIRKRRRKNINPQRERELAAHRVNVAREEARHKPKVTVVPTPKRVNFFGSPSPQEDAKT